MKITLLAILTLIINGNVFSQLKDFESTYIFDYKTKKYEKDDLFKVSTMILPAENQKPNPIILLSLNSATENENTLYFSFKGYGVLSIDKENKDSKMVTIQDGIGVGAKNDKLWISGPEGLINYSEKETVFFLLQYKDRAVSTGKIVNQDKDYLYAITRKGIIKFNDSEFILFPYNEQFNVSVADLKVDKKGSLWILSQEGLIKFTEKKGFEKLIDRKLISDIRERHFLNYNINAPLSFIKSYSTDSLFIKDKSGFGSYATKSVLEDERCVITTEGIILTVYGNDILVFNDYSDFKSLNTIRKYENIKTHDDYRTKLWIDKSDNVYIVTTNKIQMIEKSSGELSELWRLAN